MAVKTTHSSQEQCSPHHHALTKTWLILTYLIFVTTKRVHASDSIFVNERATDNLVYNNTSTIKNLTNTATKPNILLIFADDVGTGDVPGYWNTGLVNMPNLMRFVRKGVTFTDAHSTPLCAPSRYVLLSGRYQHRGVKPKGTWGINYKKKNQFKMGQKSIAEVLRNNGYNTGMFGKWHLGGVVPTKEGFNPSGQTGNSKTMLTNKNNDWSKQLGKGPKHVGFNKSYFSIEGIQRFPYVFFRNDLLETKVEDVKFWNGGTYNMTKGESKIIQAGEGAKSWDSTAYNMKLVTETKRFIKIHKKKKPQDPFFAYVALGSVHRPHSPPRTYFDGTPIAGKYPTPHMDVLGEMDRVVGSLFRYVKKKGLLDNTIIIFASDNGGYHETVSEQHGHHTNGPLRGHKGMIYEGGHRIPMMIQWENHIPKGETRSQLVGLNDLYATLCDIAGINVPSGQAEDSVSFADHLFDQSNTDGLREYLGTWQFKDALVSQAIRKNNMKLIHNYQNDTFELYDLEDDLLETNNIASDNPALVDEMFNQLQTISPCSEDLPLIKQCIKQR
mmetsp:Transcript_23261/g.28576  ORF Transcript_23261/g.28576 Transcript_23261/m.28576 type:complete len:555 (+) Transcript_23261:54-1718(+)